MFSSLNIYYFNHEVTLKLNTTLITTSIRKRGKFLVIYKIQTDGRRKTVCPFIVIYISSSHRNSTMPNDVKGPESG